MPEALLSTSAPRPTPITPFSGPAKLDSKFLSTDVSVGSGENSGSNIRSGWKPPKLYQNTSSESFSLHTATTHSLISSINGATVSPPPPHDMSAGAVNGDGRPNKVNSSTNNLFSSSCQPMRNTPNGESFAKVDSQNKDCGIDSLQDFIDIFTTLMISLPLKTHRVRFKTYPFTFTTDEALQNMANLRLTQTNRMDDPKVYFHF